MSEEPNIQIVQQSYGAFQTGDIAAFLDLLAENVEWRMPTVEGAPYPSNCNGQAEVGQFFASMAEAEEIQQFEPGEFIAQGAKVVLGHYATRIKATGRTYETDWVHVITIRDGRIAQFQEYLDTAAVMAAHRKTQSA